MNFNRHQQSGDPSNTQQNFIDVNLKLLCCRYWYLNLWDCHNMGFPFWRIYWNKNNGGELELYGKIYPMQPNSIYVIAPFTPFSSGINGKKQFTSGIHVEGSNLTAAHAEPYFMEKSLLHFFIHFNLGTPFDNVLPGIFEIELNDHLRERMLYLTKRLTIENQEFKLTFNMKLQAFIKEVLSHLGPELWKTINIDSRVLQAHRYIEQHINKKLSNPELADLVNMAPNSFARLFKLEMNITLHKFIQNRKIAKACELFENANETIDSISDKLGFSDRFHFSKTFKSVTGISPATYRSVQYVA